MTHRTLREANTVRDSSNDTLRFHRSLHDAGMYGGFERETPSAVVGLIGSIIGAVALWVLLVLLFSLGE